MSNMIQIKVEQLDKDGNAWRTFTYTCWPNELEAKLEKIERAYNMDRTRVTY